MLLGVLLLVAIFRTSNALASAYGVAVTTTMVISLITPVVAVLIGMGTIGERVTFRMILGGAGILGGIGMMRLKSLRGQA